MRGLKYFLVLFLLLVFSAQALAEEKTNAALKASIERLVADAISQGQLSGAIILVAHNGQIIYEGLHGYQDPASGQPMNLRCVFRLSSVSKVFTTMAAAVLLDKGVIGLQDPVSKWLPKFTPALADGSRPTITIAQLMNHQAGLDYGFSQGPDGAYAKAQVSNGVDNIKVSLEENMARLAKAPLIYMPGTTWKYSMASDVLGAIIAKAHGTSLPQAMQELVLQPLGLRHTTFYVDDPKLLVAPYFIGEHGLQPMAPEQKVPIGAPGNYLLFSQTRALDKDAYPSGGASLLASAPDVLALLEAIRQNGYPLLRTDTMQQLERSQNAQAYPLAPGLAFAMGWAVVTNPFLAASPQSVGTITWSGVYGHSWFVDREQKLSVLVMTNTAFEVLGLARQVRNAVYQHLPN